MTIPDSAIRLRAVEPYDADCFYMAENDETAWAGSDTVAPYSMHMLRSYAESCSGGNPFADGQLRLIAELADDSHATVALLDFYEISPLQGHAWIGIYVLPEMRRKGYASAVLRKGAAYAGRCLGIRRFGARILAGNEASRRLFAGCGYMHCGTLPQWRFADGTLHDLELWVSVC